MTAPVAPVNIRVPCLCGHGMHYGRKCSDPECECATSSPDYAGHARACGREPTDDEVRYTEEMKAAFGWRHPKAVERTCSYCLGTFSSLPGQRADTCSQTCRTAKCRALAYATDDDVPLVYERREGFSADRAAATGWGSMTTAETYAADLRVRAQARTNEDV